MNAAVEKLIQLVGYSVKLGNKIEIKADLEKEIPPAAIGEDECKQIILNLVKNAMEASGDYGTIVIKTRHIPNEKTIELVVSDSGDGISPELLPRIFDPFFSTKGEYGNSGLGLSVVYGLVSKFNGSIHVESEVGKGTTVTIILPVVPDRS
jgi:signal transduction histidine kinase